MAEAVGLAASIATLCEITKKLVQVGRNIHDAPVEIRQALRELDQLSAQLSMFRELETYTLSTSFWFNDRCSQHFCYSLSLLKEDIEQINRDLHEITPRDGNKTLLHWALRRKDAKRLTAQLQDHRLKLNTTLALATWLNNSPFDCKITLDQARDRPQTGIHGRRKQDEPAGLPDPHRKALQKPVHGMLRSCSKSVEVSWFNDFLSALILAIASEHDSTYAFSVLLKLPLAYVLSLKVMWRTSVYNRVKLPAFISTHISIRCLVEENNDFMLACKRGNVESIKFLLQTRRGGLDDITAGGRTPLSIAIEHGRFDAVKLLLECGFDVNYIYGKNQTSPLVKAIKHRHLGIARLLLDHGACCQHVTGYGWTPLSYLWCDNGEMYSPPADQFIQLLFVEDELLFSHNNTLDVWGFSVIHHAVLYGRAHDVATLIKLGVSPYTPQGPLLWDAMQNAVYENRHDVFEVLLPYYQDLDIRDTRGWTLLHISASEGHDAITRHLLELGADWQALSTPSFDVADCLQEKCFTPADAALGEGGLEDGTRRKNLFVEAVKEIRGADISTVELRAGADDIWLDACEHVGQQESLVHCKQSNESSQHTR